MRIKLNNYFKLRIKQGNNFPLTVFKFISTTGNKIAKSLATSTGCGYSGNTGAIGNTGYPAKRNITGFSALPGGRYHYGSFFSIGSNGYWWSATEYPTNHAWRRGMGHHNIGVYRHYYDKELGSSVCCVKGLSAHC